MKLFRYLSLLLLVCGLPRASYAFNLGILDPSSSTYDYTGSPLNISFTSSACGFGAPADEGCATIANDTGATLTSLIVNVPASDLVGQNTETCSSTLFTSCLVSDINNGATYQFDFTGGDIPASTLNNCDQDDNTFLIEETGVTPSGITASLDPPMSVAPEPASIWLLSSGILLLGGFLYRHRLFSERMNSPLES